METWYAGGGNDGNDDGGGNGNFDGDDMFCF